MDALIFSGSGAYLPERQVDNDEVERLSSYPRETKGCSLDEWAQRHHGGRLRHWAAAHEATSDLALRASQQALARAGVAAGALDLIVLSTFTSDHKTPSSAARLQAALGSTAKFLQVDSACTGFVDGLWVASSLMRQHDLKHVLVVAADVLSQLSAPQDWLARSVFGDGAGAVVLSRSKDQGRGIQHFVMGADGGLGDHVLLPAGGSRSPLDAERLARGEQHWRLKFSEIKPFAVERLADCCQRVAEKAGLRVSDVNWWLPHQASESILRAWIKTLGLEENRVLRSYAETGNTSGATIPLLLDRAWHRGLFKPGDWIVMPAVGAGMAWGALSYRWPEPVAP